MTSTAVAVAMAEPVEQEAPHAETVFSTGNRPDDDLTVKTIELDEDGNEIEPDVDDVVMSIRDEYRIAHGVVIHGGGVGKPKEYTFCGLGCDMRNAVFILNIISMIGCIWAIAIKELLAGNESLLPAFISYRMWLVELLGIVCTAFGLAGAIRVTRWMIWVAIAWYSISSLLLMLLLLTKSHSMNPRCLVLTCLALAWNLVCVCPHAIFMQENRSRLQHPGQRRGRGIPHGNV